MGRAGAGTGGSHKASSGGNSASRTGGGHRAGASSSSGSRAGSFSSSSNTSRGGSYRSTSTGTRTPSSPPGGGSAGRSQQHSSFGARSGGNSASRTGGGHRAGSSGNSGSPIGGSHGGGFHSSPSTTGRDSRMSRGGMGMPPPPPPVRRSGMYPPPPPPVRRPRMYSPPPVYTGSGMPSPGGRNAGRPQRRGGGCLTTAIVLIVIVIIAFFPLQQIGTTLERSNTSSSGSQNSTIVRKKLDTNNAYINDCIIDELGWFDNVSKTESQLKNFWEKTGVQPYIILRAYDEELDSDLEKEQWALNYYDENFSTENIFLYVYFSEEDSDNDVGYMAYANGYQTSSVMDSEAVEIFWNNIDKYWYTDLSTDDVIINTFNDTADTIMHVSMTGTLILMWVLIIIGLVIIGLIIIIVANMIHRRAREKAEEDQRILNTPIHDIAKDDLEDKYL